MCEKISDQPVQLHEVCDPICSMCFPTSHLCCCSWATFVTRWNRSPSTLLHLNNLSIGSLIAEYSRMISRSGHSVRLHCTIPTWCPASDTCKFRFQPVYQTPHHNLLDGDLHDLHDLRTRFLLFIHNLLESLRSSGVGRVTPLCGTPAQRSFPDRCLICPLTLGFTALPSMCGASRSQRIAGKDSRHRDFPHR